MNLQFITRTLTICQTNYGSYEITAISCDSFILRYTAETHHILNESFSRDFNLLSDAKKCAEAHNQFLESLLYP